MTNSVPDENSLDRQLRDIAAFPWLPAELLQIAGETLRLQSQSRSRLISRNPDLLPLAAPDAHNMGAPLLRTEYFPIDFGPARLLWDELSALLGTFKGNPAEGVRSLNDVLETNAELPAMAFTAYTHGDETFFSTWEQRFPQTPSILRFLAQAALTPQLADTAEKLASRHDASRVWEHGHCPYCGSRPYMGELTGKEGQRWHVCSYCSARYRAARLQCPYCGERDEKKLRMFSADVLPFFEVQVCATCMGYIKLADLRQKSGRLTTALNDLASLPLDMLACREGYMRPTLSAWGF